MKIGESGNLLDTRDELPCKAKTSNPKSETFWFRMMSAKGKQMFIIL